MIAKLFMDFIFHLENDQLLVVSLTESIDEFERRFALVWFFSEEGFGKDNLLDGGGILEVVFKVNNSFLRI